MSAASTIRSNSPAKPFLSPSLPPLRQAPLITMICWISWVLKMTMRTTNEDEDEGKELACNMDDDMDNNMDNNINELDALSAEEQANFLEATEAVKEAITKVRTLPFMHMLLPYMTPSDSKAVLCNHSLDYNRVASMVLYLQGQPPQAQFDPV